MGRVPSRSFPGPAPSNPQSCRTPPPPKARPSFSPPPTPFSPSPPSTAASSLHTFQHEHYDAHSSLLSAGTRPSPHIRFDRLALSDAYKGTGRYVGRLEATEQDKSASVGRLDLSSQAQVPAALPVAFDASLMRPRTTPTASSTHALPQIPSHMFATNRPLTSTSASPSATVPVFIWGGSRGRVGRPFNHSAMSTRNASSTTYSSPTAPFPSSSRFRASDERSVATDSSPQGYSKTSKSASAGGRLNPTHLGKARPAPLKLTNNPLPIGSSSVSPSFAPGPHHFDPARTPTSPWTPSSTGTLTSSTWYPNVPYGVHSKSLPVTPTRPLSVGGIVTPPQLATWTPRAQGGSSRATTAVSAYSTTTTPFYHPTLPQDSPVRSSSLKRDSDSIFQFEPPSPTRPRAYRRIGASHSLGLQQPISQASKNEAEPPALDGNSKSTHDGLMTNSDPISSGDVFSSSPAPPALVTLPRLEALDEPFKTGGAHTRPFAQLHDPFTLRPWPLPNSLFRSSFASGPQTQTRLQRTSANLASLPDIEGDDSLSCSSDGVGPSSTALGQDQGATAWSSIKSPAAVQAQSRTMAAEAVRAQSNASVMVMNGSQIKASHSTATSTSQAGPASTFQADHPTPKSSKSPSSSQSSSTMARLDLIRHAHHLKRFLSGATQLLAIDRLDEVGDLMVESSRVGALIDKSGTAAKPVPGSMFVSRPVGSEYGADVLEGSWTLLNPSLQLAEQGSNHHQGGDAGHSRHTLRLRATSRQGATSTGGAARLPTQVDLSLSGFETFYLPDSKARRRLETVRQLDRSGSASSSSSSASTTTTATSTRTSVGKRAAGAGSSSSSASASTSAAEAKQQPPMPILHRMPLPLNDFRPCSTSGGPPASTSELGVEEVLVSAVLWDGQVWLTGTDICRIVRFRFEAFGRRVVNINKLNEGIYSDLRNIKPGAGASCQDPKSAFLKALYIYDTIQSTKRQKTFHWFPPAMHDQLFLDQLAREYERAVKGETMCTEAVREPALSFAYSGYLTLPQQLGLGMDTARPAPLHHATQSQRELVAALEVNEAVVYALAVEPVTPGAGAGGEIGP